MNVLGQADRLERLLTRCKDLAARGLSVSKGPKMRDVALRKASASLRPGAHPHERHQPIPLFEELFRNDKHFVERLALIFEEPRDFRATAIGSGVEQAIIRLPLEISMRVSEGGIPVAAVYRFVCGSQSLDLCPPHRWRVCRLSDFAESDRE